MELKNDLAVTGTLHSVDQYLNIKLENVTVVDQARFPQLVRSRAEVACLFVYVSVCLGVLVRIWADAATTPALLVRSCCEDATCGDGVTFYPGGLLRYKLSPAAMAWVTVYTTCSSMSGSIGRGSIGRGSTSPVALLPPAHER